MPTTRNILAFVTAVIVVTELNARFFNLTTLLNWHSSEIFYKLGSYYLERFATFLFLSVPEIFTGIAMSKLLVGRFKIHWCLGLSLFLLYYYHPTDWFVVDMSYWNEVVTYSAYFLHPLSLVVAAIVALKWPNLAFKRDALKRAP